MLIACLAMVAGSAAFAEDPPDLHDRTQQSDLKDNETPAPSSTHRSSDEPMRIEADYFVGNVEGQFHAQGRVTMDGQGIRATADDLFGSMPDEEMGGSGNVAILRGGDFYTGTRFFSRGEEHEGFVENATYYVKKYGAHGKARHINFAGAQQQRAYQATYTTCDLGHDDWYLSVSQLDMDRQLDVGVARHVSLRFKEIPVLYTPWIDFPLSGRRKSGLLSPVIGTTERGGFELTLPVYLNLAPNYDATIAPRYMDKRGVLVNNDVRYLARSFSGELHADVLSSDRVTGTSRSAFAFKHAHDFGAGWTGSLNLNQVSDDRYFVDLSDKISATSQTNLLREGTLSYGAGWWNANARIQRFQTLQDPLAPVAAPYFRDPQLTLTATRLNERGFDLNFQGEVVDFKHATQVAAVRQTYYPSVQLPLQNSYFGITPKIGLNHRKYHFTNVDRPNEQRTTPIFSVDSSTALERDTVLFGESFVQTLEPRLYYVNIPFRDQKTLPLFDTGEADFNFGQIFTENQFSGGDRINDANQLTAAVGSRLLDSATGEERLRGILGERFYFKDQEVSLNDQVRKFSRSDILAALSGRVSRDWTVDAAVQYDVNQAVSKKFSSAFRYQPEPGKLANFAYRRQRDVLESVDVSAQWPLSQRWTGLGRWNYSLKDNQTIEALAGLEYNAGCWVVRMVAHRFATATNIVINSFFLQIEFTGLAGLGSNPLDVLRQNISGYTKTNDLPRN